MKLALQLLQTPYDLLGAVPIMWGPMGWAESYSVDPGNPDFTVFSNAPYCMLFASYNLVGDLPRGSALRIVYLPNFTTTTDGGTTNLPRPGSLNFGVRDSIDASTEANSPTAYSRFGPISYGDFSQFKDSSGATFQSAISDCGPGATPDIIIFYS